MADKIKCPRCGAEQPEAEVCKKCGVNIPRYIALKASRKASPTSGKAPSESIVLSPTPQRPAQPTQRPQPPLARPVQPKAPIEPNPATKPPESATKPQPAIQPPQPAIQPPQPASEGVVGEEPLSDFPGAGGEMPPQPPPPIAPVSSSSSGGGPLPGLGDLFSRTWAVYKKRLCALTGIILLSVLIVAIPAGIFAGLGFLLVMSFPGAVKSIFMSLGTIGMLFVMTGVYWGQAAFVFAVSDETMPVKEAFKRGWSRIWSFMWMASLVSFIVMGGFFLVIVPGVMFAVWFTFAMFVLATEDERGMNALLKSKEYVRGRFWPVFGRLIVLWLISAVVGIVPIIGPILSLLYAPFMVLGAYELYKDIRPENVEYHFSRGYKCKWVSIGAAGYVFAIIMAIVLMATVLNLSFQQFKAALLGAGGFPGQFQPGQFQMEPLQIPPGDMPEMSFTTPLEGQWSGSEINGSDGWTFNFSGTSVEVRGPGGEWYAGMATVNEHAEPYALDVLIMDTGQDRYAGKTAKSIYKLEAGVLTICGSEPGAEQRPADFTPAKPFRCLELRSAGGGGTSQPAPSAPASQSETVADVAVFVYAINYKGIVLLNDETFYTIKGEKDMNYNYTSGGSLSPGTNKFEVVYDSLPDAGTSMREIKVKVYRHDFQTGKETVIHQWVASDKGGKQTFEVVLGR